MTQDQGDTAGFENSDLSGARFRNVDLTGSVMRGVLLIDADIDGVISGLRINGIEVAPLVGAELDRLHPERRLLRSNDPDDLRSAWSYLEDRWRTTTSRALALGPEAIARRVEDEWSFAETVRHLIFVTDAWFSRSILDLDDPFHRIALPPAFVTDAVTYGVDIDASPSIDEILAVRAERQAAVRTFVGDADDAALARRRMASLEAGFPPQAERTATECLHVLFDEEWAHHRYAVRDLDRIESGLHG